MHDCISNKGIKTCGGPAAPHDSLDMQKKNFKQILPEVAAATDKGGLNAIMTPWLEITNYFSEQIVFVRTSYYDRAPVK